MLFVRHRGLARKAPSQCYYRPRWTLLKLRSCSFHSSAEFRPEASGPLGFKHLARSADGPPSAASRRQGGRDFSWTPVAVARAALGDRARSGAFGSRAKHVPGRSRSFRPLLKKAVALAAALHRGGGRRCFGVRRLVGAFGAGDLSPGEGAFSARWSA